MISYHHDTFSPPFTSQEEEEPITHLRTQKQPSYFVAYLNEDGTIQNYQSDKVGDNLIESNVIAIPSWDGVWGQI